MHLIDLWLNKLQIRKKMYPPMMPIVCTFFSTIAESEKFSLGKKSSSLFVFRPRTHVWHHGGICIPPACHAGGNGFFLPHGDLTSFLRLENLKRKLTVCSVEKTGKNEEHIFLYGAKRVSWEGIQTKTNFYFRERTFTFRGRREEGQDV